MAIDNFTDTNGTHLADHDANWTLSSANSGDVDNITINNNAARGTSWRDTWVHYNGSTEESSEITALAHSAEGLCQAGVRMDVDSVEGYCAYLAGGSGGNWTYIMVKKNGAWLANNSGESFSQASSHTIKITSSGTSTVSLTISIDGNVEYETSDSSSPLSGPGHPGMCVGCGSIEAVDAIDDWTDGDTGGASIPRSNPFSRPFRQAFGRGGL